jgi:MFS family permease
MSVLRDVRKIISVTARGSRATARGVRATATGTTRASRWVTRHVGWARRRSGVGNVGMMRLLDLHAVSCAGDTLITIGLAGTIFFTVPTNEARGRVALYLLVTMVPFALLAPVIGPTLDRFRHGRRYALAATMAGRALLAWLIAENLFGFGLYPAAFGVLALSRAYGVARSAAVPRLLPPGLGLSQAGARASVYGTVAGALVAPLGVATFWFGPQWPLRVAALIFVVGIVVALNLPPKADSDPPEIPPKAFHLPWRHRADGGDRVLSGRLVVATLVGSACARALYGFLLLFLAFAIREGDLPPAILGIPLRDEVALGVVGATLAFGTFAATAIGSGLRIRRPLVLQATGLVLVTGVAALSALRFTLATVMLLCLATAVASGLAKLAVDATIQERVVDTVRASAFAHAETLLMLAWVSGGAIGLIPFDGRVGLLVAAAGITAAAFRAVQVTHRYRGEVLAGRAAAAALTAAGTGPTAGAGPARTPDDRTAGRSAGPDDRTPPGRGDPRSRGGADPVGRGAGGPAGPGDDPAARGATESAGAAAPTRAADADDEPPPGFHIFRPSPPDSGVADPRGGP